MKEHQRPLTLAGLSHLIKQLKSGLNLKQDTLTAGDNIKITSDTISATVNIDQHSMTLQTRDCLHDIQFDALLQAEGV